MNRRAEPLSLPAWLPRTRRAHKTQLGRDGGSALQLVLQPAAAAVVEEATIARQAYPSDVSDSQWNALRPVLAAAQPAAGPGQEADLREVVNAVSYVLSTGIRWPMLPHEFPPWGIVHAHYRRWRNDGTWQRAEAVLTTAPEGTDRGEQESGQEQRPFESEGALSPIRRLRIAKMCPYLSSRSDRMTRRAYPSTQNGCRADRGGYAHLDTETQDDLCLNERHAKCERYQQRMAEDAGQPDPTEAVHAASTA